jgi:DNA-directed RNA polymerase subunit L
MSIPVNFTNFTQYLRQVSQNQIRITRDFSTSNISTVNAVSSTSNYMNINSKTGNIIVNTTTGTIEVPQPVITPIPINNINAFIQTSNNQVAVTSKGNDDTIISSVLDSIINIEDVTNSGYTKNNSVLNLYDSISSNYWNPQVNEGNANPYFYKLNYTFTGTSEIFKFVIKNNNDFPGFTNIRLYPSSDPLNYVDVTPSTDTNNQYLNQTVVLLIDENGNPLFNTKYMTIEFTLNPSVQPNTFYQYGQAYGVIYNTDTLGLRAGNYINTNTGASTGSAGSKLLWTTEYLLNQTTATGTNNTDNNYLVSSDGQYRMAQNNTFYQWSNDYGEVYTKKTLITTSNMISTPDGHYTMVTNGTTGYISNDYGETLTSKTLDNTYVNYPYFDMLYTGQYQMFASTPKQSGNVFTISVYKNENYGIGSFSANIANYTVPHPFFTVRVINIIVKIDGTMLLVLNSLYPPYGGNENYGNVIYATLSPGTTGIFTNTIPFSVSVPTLLYALEQNYSNDTNEGQYKSGFGLYNWGGDYGNPCFFVTTNDSTYTLFNNSSIFPEYYYYLTAPTLRLDIVNCQIKISNDGSKQVAIVQWRYTFFPSQQNLITSYYSVDSGSTWQKSNSYPSLLNSLSNIVSTNNFSIIQACGGYYYNYNGQYRTDPISYISTDYGNTWILNSAINPASSIVSTNFYTINSITNKTYFQIKDLNQNQVLGVSDNGFNMTKDLRVNNKNAYVIGGTLTVGPDTASALLNDYSVNIDGTLSARNIVLLSDERFKIVTDKLDQNDAYNKVKNIKIVKYKFNDRPDDDRIYTGMIAQQLQNVIENAVDINTSTYETTEGIIDIENTYSINYTVILSYLISTLQFTNIKIKDLEEKIKLKFNVNI